MKPTALTGCSLFEEFFPEEKCGHVMVGATVKDGKVINHLQGFCGKKARPGCADFQGSPRCGEHCMKWLSADKWRDTEAPVAADAPSPASRH